MSQAALFIMSFWALWNAHFGAMPLGARYDPVPNFHPAIDFALGASKVAVDTIECTAYGLQMKSPTFDKQSPYRTGQCFHKFSGLSEPDTRHRALFANALDDLGIVCRLRPED
ncbi:hypothetical protein BJY52DRAFT_1298383 [Lactarius psammicola]|nr:hypothetical protein BJY52DRAFT_1298383 [Lactarius psammicola]